MQKNPFVTFVELLKRVTGFYTYQIEYAVVFIVLSVTAAISDKGVVEWLGVAAVFVSFMHAKVANRLAEREALRMESTEENKYPLPYYYKITRWFYLKEILWFAYFLFLGAYSALAGVLIFLLYEPWRSAWRKKHPLKEKLQEENKSA